MRIRGIPQLQTYLLPPWQSVAAGTTAYIDLPVGFRYHNFHLPYGGTTFDVSKMDNIRLKLNGATVWQLTGTRQDDLNKFDGLPAASTNKVVTLSMQRHDMRDRFQEFFTAINTGPNSACVAAPLGVRTARLEIDISAAAVAPTLPNPVAEISANNPAQGQAIFRTETWFENVPGAGEFLHNHKYNGDPSRGTLFRLMLGDTPANITKLRLLENNQEKFNRDSGTNAQIQSAYKLRTPQAGYVVWDSAEAGNFGSAYHLAGVADFQVRSTHTGANVNLPVIAQTLGVLPN
jgi:hypothetical protein